MAKKEPLKTLPPEPLDERSPLLGNAASTGEDELEAQAEQEIREHDVGSVPLAEEPTTLKLVSTMGSLWLATFFAALDTTVVATLSGPISSSFQSGTSFSWIASGYLIANAAFQPLSGKMTDIYGRRAGVIFASTFFAIGTLLCGIARDDWVMILGRVVGGAGGGCLNTVSTFVASDLIPLRKRGVWQGMGNIVFGMGMGLGGVFGGYINDTLGWRYAFYIQLPFIVVAGIVGTLTVKVPVKKTTTAKIKRVDFLGAFTLVSALVLLLLGLNSGGNVVPWSHPLVYVSLPLSFVFLLIFIFVEDRVASEPVIPIRLILNQSVAAACLTMFFETMSMFALIYYCPIFFEVVRGVSSTRAGTLFIPQAAGTAIGSLGSGLIMRATGKYRLLNFAMQLLQLLAASLILGFFDQNVPTAPPFIFLLMGGLAYGSMLTITLIALISAVDHKYQAVITSASYAFRSTGSSIGITIASAVFQNLLKSLLFERFGDEPGAADRIRRIRDSTDELARLPQDWKEGVIEAYVGALRGVWVVMLGFGILAAFTSLFIKQHKLYSNLERK
ncbi:MFS multidrug transporter like protein [Zymoseptoria brevis]|uniref:MFS multidrug transporter like protein n=1 Tax=Zymoseptoria brevis TaxID=1047168 RepID=A0A0F4GVY0_9PEZI|nr:MFS multidrug transporter like protein [Zymoseptoria brevis]